MTLNVNAPDFKLPANLQAIYDHVAAHLLRQGKPSLAPKSERERLFARGDTICRYRGTRGTKCAVGALIPDARYWPEMEGQWGPHVLANLGFLPWEELEAGYKSRHVCLLAKLQTLHDDAAAWPEKEVVQRWEAGLAALAEEFGLRPVTRSA